MTGVLFMWDFFVRDEMLRIHQDFLDRFAPPGAGSNNIFLVTCEIGFEDATRNGASRYIGELATVRKVHRNRFR